MSGAASVGAVERFLCDACDESNVELVICVWDENDVYAEGRGSNLTCAASLQLDRQGDVARSLSFSCDPVERPPAWDPRERPALLPLMSRYLKALNDGDFDAAANCFSADCLYSHPPYRPGEPQAEFRGRDELAELWPARRGVKRVETDITRCVQSGNHAFVEGVADGGSFLSTVVLDSDGLIARYLAFYTPRLIPRLPDQAAVR